MKLSKLYIHVLAAFALMIFVSSCTTSAKVFSAEGTVETIENGKDGYTASLKDNQGKYFDAVISRVKLQQNYKTLKAGDVVKLYGDTMRLDNKLRIIVNKIEP